MATLTLKICGAHGIEVGTLRWDQEAGTVSGYMADTIGEYGQSPWYFTPMSFGDENRPALHSNDGFIALLAMLNLSTPDLKLINEAGDNGLPGMVN